MQIDVTKLLTNSINKINIDEDITIPKEFLEKSLIEDLQNIHFFGNILQDETGELLLNGSLSGIMILKDDITLEPVNYHFDTEIEENFANNQNILDITEVLWQNILVEVPSKVRATNENIELSGNGWRVISEETYNSERNKQDNPFSSLSELLDTKEEE